MNRSKEIVKTSFVAIATNTVLVVIKIIAGLLSNSISIVMDAINNLSDAMSSIITIIGTKLAGRKPDKEHPYGYGRIEYISSLIISVIVLLAGVSSFRESITKIINPEEVNYTVLTFVIIIIGIVTKLILGKYVSSQGEKLNSESLIASGKDASFDAIITRSTLVAGLINVLLKVNLEGILGAIISVVIIKSGIEILIDNLNYIVGNRIESEISEKVKETINSYPEIKGTYDLALHRYGPQHIIGSCHVELDDNLTALDIHRLSQNIMAKIYRDFGIIITLGIYASNDSSEIGNQIKSEIYSILEKHPDVLQMHGFYVDESCKLVSFDLVMDFKSANGDTIKKELIEYLSNKYGYRVNINIDSDYSD